MNSYIIYSFKQSLLQIKLQEVSSLVQSLESGT